MDVQIDGEQFFTRLQRLQSDWTSKKSVWGNCDAICIPFGSSRDDLNYSKSSSIHSYLLGYEFPDSIIVITQGHFYFMATAKKCSYLQAAIGKAANVHILEKTKDEGMNREHLNTLIGAMRKGGGKKIGSLYKAEHPGTFIPAWMDMIEQNQLEKIEISPAIGLFLAVKDENELDRCKRAAVLSNKVMKHGFVAEMENILDKDSRMKHEDLSEKVESIIYDPSKINLKVSADVVESCFSPIIQSGGVYDIRVNASSNADHLTPDIILCTLGARYRTYCANVSRTFMVDAPKKVEKTYGVLLDLYGICLAKMVEGVEMKEVMAAAHDWLGRKDAELLAGLPKVLGFAIGLEFRDSTLLLNSSNSAKFAENMVFNLSVGFQGIPLTAADKVGASDSMQKLSTFSLLLADTVRVAAGGAEPEILTKVSKDFGEVSYNMSQNAGDAEDGSEDGSDDGESSKGRGSAGAGAEGSRRSGLRSRVELAANESAAVQRAQRQREVMDKRLEESRQRARNGEVVHPSGDVITAQHATDLKTYSSSDDFPKDTRTNQVKVDMVHEALLLPIHGRSVPFHISTIKSISMPDPDKATYMRINFYIPGAALGKDVPKNMQQLVMKYGKSMPFIKELTFRSMNSRNLSNAFIQFQELRKRVRQREQRAEHEKDLVVQTKLIRIKDQRIPRLADVSLRPPLSGKKSLGTLEAHQNGMRFTTTKGEVLDVMYSNIKHAIYQPCDRTTKVLVHFHLKDFVMIGKKKQNDIQFYTEVVDESVNLDAAKRYSHDVDELDDEQRERERRRKLNAGFKEFCSKMEKVAQHYDFNVPVDSPYKKNGFEGNVAKEMVLIQPTTHCLVNLTETPFFLLTLSEIEHCHFERLTFGTKNFDLVFIFKNMNLAPRTVSVVDLKAKDLIQDWLNLVEIPFTEGPLSLNFTHIMTVARQQGDRFYETTDEYGQRKPAGWMFLSAYDSDEEEEEEEGGAAAGGGGEEEGGGGRGREDDDDDSSFSGGSDESSESESEDDDSSFDDEDEDSDDDEEDGDDDLEEPGQDWDEQERTAEAEDRAKRSRERDDDVPSKKSKPSHSKR